jgi:MFS family permease
MISASTAQAKHRSDTSRLPLFFAVAYLSQGISCAQFGVVAQPIQYYMMKGLQLTAAQVAFFMSIMMIPWVVKPLFGLLCDFIPLFGYRRKSYLIVSNVVAAAAFTVMLFCQSLAAILAALFVTAITMSLATALMVGQAVESGRKDGNARLYFCIQEVGYYAANMLAALAGGLLCQFLMPDHSLHVAAGISIIPLLAVSYLTATLLSEEKSQLNLERLRETGQSFLEAFRSKALWIAALFSWFWSFIFSVGTPLYFFESNTLRFSQAEIGQLAAWNSAGLLIAAMLYPKLTKSLSLRTQLFAAVVLVSTSTIAYLGLSNFISAVFLELLRGFANMVAILSIYLLAAASCPERTEVTVMAILVAVRNTATSAATLVGGYLFTYTFHAQFQPLVLCAAIAPAISLCLLAHLPKQEPQPIFRNDIESASV